ncbi:MAG: endonuclease III [Vulcanimicrobiota bacterium]
MNITLLLERLEQSVPNFETELHHQSPFQLLMATILSAQCTDERVNQVTPGLFARYPDAQALAVADQAELEELIRPTGFYRNKANSLKKCCAALCERHQGTVPSAMDELVALPGVGRKTANLMRGQAFGMPAVVVDTHVKRIAGRLGLSSSSDADKIEQDLQEVLPENQWWPGSSRLLLHGRYVCKAKKPACQSCQLADLCPSRQ